MFPSQEEVKRIREKYPVGTTIILDHMGNDPHPIPDGTKGTVQHVDDAGTLHCVFENGRSQAVRLPKEYRFSSDEVIINRIGEIVLLMPKTSKWDSFMKAIDLFSDDFMKDGRDDQGVQERETL